MMRDDLMGGILATAIAAPAVIICCGGGTVLLAGGLGAMGAVGGWLSGVNGLSVVVAAAGVGLAWRGFLRHNASGACCNTPKLAKAARHG
ncbi:hypothetical protein [Roseinatronobacter sp. S2]|uniref:hypothetical protein n=1 Tax=Roseinatronobacter sp. S2 TaxID=3035471 RepID=UPI00240FCDA2|nr:hypothetical protein [Roseinatronobacter sp. S2]WFE77284.1 hypothetical protein P8S53_21180 [Roseinatronobacter sp. S2]